MNIFKSLLFLEGYITDPRVLDDEFAQRYSNKLAAQRRFGNEFAQPGFARRDGQEESPLPVPAACCG